MTGTSSDKSKLGTYHSLKEVAARWSVCERSVRREIANKKLVAHRFGGSVRVSDEDLKAYERLRRGV